MKWIVAILLGAAVLGWGATYMPIVAFAAAGLMALIWIGPVSLRRTTETLSASFFVVLVAGTDFRLRDPYESVQVAVDTQVAFELVVYFLLFLVAIRATYVIQRERLRFTTIEWSLVAYLLLAAFSVMWTPVVAYTATRAIQLGTLLFLSYACVRALGPGRTIRALAISVVAYVVISLVAAAPLQWSEWTSGARLSWFAVHPIQVGTYAATGAILIITDLQFGDRADRRRRLKQGLLAFLVLVLVMAVSRGPILAFLVAAISISLLRRAPSLAATAAISLFVLITLVVYNTASGLGGILDVAASSDNALLAFLFRGQSAEELATLTGRVELWEAMSVAFREHPVMGHGYQATRVVGMAILPWAGEAHNGLAQSLIDLGILGTAILLFTTLRVLFGSYFAVARDHSETTRYHVAIFGLTLYLLVNSVVTASFAGPPGYEPLVLFVCVMAGEQLRRIDRYRLDVPAEHS